MPPVAEAGVCGLWASFEYLLCVGDRPSREIVSGGVTNPRHGLHRQGVGGSSPVPPTVREPSGTCDLETGMDGVPSSGVGSDPDADQT